MYFRRTYNCKDGYVHFRHWLHQRSEYGKPIGALYKKSEFNFKISYMIVCQSLWGEWQVRLLPFYVLWRKQFSKRSLLCGVLPRTCKKPCRIFRPFASHSFNGIQKQPGSLFILVYLPSIPSSYPHLKSCLLCETVFCQIL